MPSHNLFATVTHRVPSLKVSYNI